MTTRNDPLVSVAIPLHRSRGFVETIVRNIQHLGLPDAEILISDRHQEDDTLEVLASRLARDHRVRVLAARDRIGWVDHYNALLGVARGRYFTWMPHDDDCPPGYVSGLVSALEERPDAILAFGQVQVVGQRGETLFADERDAPLIGDGDRWTSRSALEMLMFRGQWLPQFHGVFRREPVVGAGLLIRPTAGNVEADLYWVFGIGLLGEVRLVSGCSYVKHLHGTNASISWGARTMRHVVDGFVVPWRYLRGTTPGIGDAVRVVSVLTVWTAFRAVACLTQNSRWPSRQTRERIRRVSRTILFRT